MLERRKANIKMNKLINMDKKQQQNQNQNSMKIYT